MRFWKYLAVAALLFTLIPVAKGAQVEHFLAADRLYQLGLISGTGTDAAGQPLFELDRAPTRSEAITVLVKLLGKADEASKGGWQMPFTDVPDWAKNFVGYAYENGLTSGTSATTFGGDDPVTAAQYITFVLKALGYSATEDFAWNKAWELSDQLGVTDGRYDASTATFLRGDVFLISEAALAIRLKNSEQILADKLIETGVFGRADYENTDAGTGEAPSTQSGKQTPDAGEGNTELSGEQIYAKCAPAVFVVEALDSKRNVVNRGSGFFLTESGVGVTNFHVLQNAYSGRVLLDNGSRELTIECVYDYDVMEDWVVFQVSGSGYPCVELAQTGQPAGGATVYAIGNPLGQQCTVSQGIVSNPDRVERGMHYIQTTAAISVGNSGGILADVQGRVIGITSNSYLDGQNLNLALPISVLDGYSTESEFGFSVLMRYDEGGDFNITHQYGSESIQSQAYYQLQNYIFSKWNYAIGDNIACQNTCFVGEEEASCQLVYVAGDKQQQTEGAVWIRVECRGKNNTVCELLVLLSPSSTKFFAVYNVYDIYTGQQVFYGERTIDGTFKRTDRIPFLEMKGNTSYMAHGAKFVSELAAQGLLVVHEVLTQISDGAYGVDAFGINPEHLI